MTEKEKNILNQELWALEGANEKKSEATGEETAV